MVCQLNWICYYISSLANKNSNNKLKIYYYIWPAKVATILMNSTINLIGHVKVSSSYHGLSTSFLLNKILLTTLYFNHSHVYKEHKCLYLSSRCEMAVKPAFITLLTRGKSVMQDATKCTKGLVHLFIKSCKERNYCEWDGNKNSHERNYKD